MDFEVDCPPPACLSTRRSFDLHGKGNGNFVLKRGSKNEKKVVSLLDLKEMKARNDCEIACDCVKRANVVLHVRLCKEIFARKHTATHKQTSAQPTHMCHDDRREACLPSWCNRKHYGRVSQRYRFESRRGQWALFSLIPSALSFVFL